MSDFIGIDVLGETELAEKLAKLPDEYQDAITDDVAKYLLNVLKTYPPKKHVSRATAYPGAVIEFPSGKRVAGYFSIAQFRYVMALVARGGVPYKRTQDLSKGWQQIGRGKQSIIVNESEYAKFVMGGNTQANHMRLIGWKTLPEILKERSARIIEIADAGIKKALRKLGL